MRPFATPRPPHPAGLSATGILYGWPEFAAYLRRSVWTVRRWHKLRAMPISYLGESVVIPRAALDLWVLAAPSHKPSWRDRPESERGAAKRKWLYIRDTSERIPDAASGTRSLSRDAGLEAPAEVTP